MISRTTVQDITKIKSPLVQAKLLVTSWRFLGFISKVVCCCPFSGCIFQLPSLVYSQSISWTFSIPVLTISLLSIYAFTKPTQFLPFAERQSISLVCNNKYAFQMFDFWLRLKIKIRNGLFLKINSFEV